MSFILEAEHTSPQPSRSTSPTRTSPIRMSPMPNGTSPLQIPERRSPSPVAQRQAYQDYYSDNDDRVSLRALKEFMEKEIREVMRQELNKVFASRDLEVSAAPPVVGSGTLVSLEDISRQGESASDPETKEAGRLNEGLGTVTQVLGRTEIDDVDVDDDKSAGEVDFEFFEHAVYSRFKFCFCLVEWINWFGTEPLPPPRNDFFSRLADNPIFPAVMALVIIANCVFLWLEADDSFPIDGNRGELDLLNTTIEPIFITIYFIELALNIWRQRWHFFVGIHWAINWLDFTLVVVGLTSIVLQAFLPGYSSLKLLRMLKMLKAIRVLRVMVRFKQLRAILTSLSETAETLISSFAMLFLMLTMFSLFLVPGMATAVSEGGFTPQEREELEQEFGSVGRSFVSLLKAITIDWYIGYSILQPAGVLYQGSFLFLVFFVQLALMNIILGLFVEQAMSSLEGDKEDKAIAHKKAEIELTDDIKDFLYDFNDEEGVSRKMMTFISPGTWKKLVADGRFFVYLESIGLQAPAVTSYYQQCSKDSVGERVEIERFAKGCVRLRGPATNFNMLEVKRTLVDLDSKLSSLLRTDALSGGLAMRKTADSMSGPECADFSQDPDDDSQNDEPPIRVAR